MSSREYIADLLPPELLAELRRLHYSSRRLATYDLVGSYRSAFRGHGIEFEEVREYSPGDDIRRIDWKVTARTGVPYIKIFREERELSVLLALDVSNSMFTGSKIQLRAQMMSKVSALLALVAARNRDRIGLVTFSNKIERFHAPALGRKALTRILGDVLVPLSATPDGSHIVPRQTSLSTAAEFILRTVRRHTIVFVISDFFDSNYQEAFAKLAHSHELVAIRCLDALDLKLPDIGLCYLRNPETGHIALVNTSSSQEQLRYSQQIKASRDYLLNTAERYRFHALEIFTDRPFIPALRDFFSHGLKRLHSA